MNMNGTYVQSINIQLDSSVKSITKVAAMCLSGAIANGIMLTQNPNPNIIIFKNKIEFGKCYNPDLQGVSGNVFPCFYIEYENLVYYFNSGYKFSIFGKRLDYAGIFAPSVPDNPKIFDLIYPKFA